ncbi:MAG: glucose-1-phosphate cytidylyltransferase [Dehalococcoidia bacterium]|nr:glucose-1-phosphate cytidylyltransferase [Dehalococcoidia bacterium]
MTDIGGRPLLWHLMTTFSNAGLKDFVVELGGQGEAVKRYLLDLLDLSRNLRVHFKDGRIDRGENRRADWTVDLIDAEGAQLQGLRPHLRRGTFVLCRGDALSDVNMSDLLAFHRGHGRLASVVAVRPAARFGKLDLVGDEVVDFAEKPSSGEGWTSSGLYVLEPDIFDVIDADDPGWERQLIERLSTDGELMAYKHESFWQRMDSLRDRQVLESLWQSGSAPWKNWE